MRAPDINWKGLFKQTVALLVFTAAVGGALYGTYRVAGLLATIVYSILFVLGLTLVPLALNLLGDAMPLSTRLGRGHIVLGAFAFNHHYLVDRGTRWEWCPGGSDYVYIDGEKVTIDAGEDKKTVLGWRPFGVLRYKDDETYVDQRIDTVAERARGDTAVDGGTVELGGFDVVSPPAVAGDDGNWVLDLRRVFSRGIRKIGDIEIIETAEEIIERGQVEESRLGLNNPTVTFFIALAFGLISAFAYVWLMGGGV